MKVSNLQIRKMKIIFIKLYFLNTRNCILLRLLQDKTIVSCPKESLCNVNITDDLVSLMTFNEFNKASSKHKVILLLFYTGLFKGNVKKIHISNFFKKQ